MKTDIFQSCGHCWVFQIYWHIDYSTFTASSLRIWNSSTGIPLPPLDLFLVILPKAHLTLHSKMSGSRWVITPSWLSGSWRSFLYSSSVYSCHLFFARSQHRWSHPWQRSWGKAWYAKVSQDSRGPLDLPEHLPQNQNLSVLLFYEFHQLLWH